MEEQQRFATIELEGKTERERFLLHAERLMALVALGAYRRRALPRWLTGAAFPAAFVSPTLLGWAANLGGQIRHTEIGGTATASSGEEVYDRKR